MVVGMILGMIGSQAAVGRLGRHLLHIGILLIAAGAAGLALTVTGAHTASAWDLVPGMFFVGAGVGATIGQLFRFILTSVSMDEVGSASGVFEAVQQLSTALRGCRPGHHLLLRLWPPPPARRAADHRLGMPGATHCGLHIRVRASDARAGGTASRDCWFLGCSVVATRLIYVRRAHPAVSPSLTEA